MSEQTSHFRVLPPIGRRDGEPARCSVCNAVCIPSRFGPPRCKDHRPPCLQGSDPATRRAMLDAANDARRRRRAATQTAAIDAVRVDATANDTAKPTTLRDRLRARRRTERGGG